MIEVERKKAGMGLECDVCNGIISAGDEYVVLRSTIGKARYLRLHKECLSGLIKFIEEVIEEVFKGGK